MNKTKNHFQCLCFVLFRRRKRENASKQVTTKRLQAVGVLTSMRDKRLNVQTFKFERHQPRGGEGGVDGMNRCDHGLLRKVGGSQV